MNIKCPNCKTVFEINARELAGSVRNLKCSVCNYMWSLDESRNSNDNKKEFFLKKILLLNVLVFLLALICVFIFRYKLEYIDIYWQGFFSLVDTLIPIK